MSDRKVAALLLLMALEEVPYLIDEKSEEGVAELVGQKTMGRERLCRIRKEVEKLYYGVLVPALTAICHADQSGLLPVFREWEEDHERVLKDKEKSRA